MRHVAPLVVLMFVTVSIAGCDSKKKQTQPPPKVVVKAKAQNMTDAPSPATVKAWEGLQKNLKRTRISPRKRASLIKGFLKRHGSSKFAPEAKALLYQLETGGKIKRSANLASRHVHKARSSAWSVVFSQGLKADNPARLRDVFLFGVLNGASTRSNQKESIDKVTLVSPSGLQRPVDKALYLGPGTTRYGLYKTVRMFFPEVMPKKCRYLNHSCFIEVSNGVSQKFGAKPVYIKPGHLNPERISEVLAMFPTTKPTTTLLNVPAMAIYKAYRPAFVSMATAHSVLTRKVGRKKALRAYEAAVKKHQPYAKVDGYNNKMLGFYAQVAKKHGIDARMPERKGNAYIFTGFWLRRMADGTDKLFGKALKDIIKNYEPALYKKLY